MVGHKKNTGDSQYDLAIEDGLYFLYEKKAEYKSILDDRIFKFTVRVIKLLRTIEKSAINSAIIYQLTKSSTSIGANYEESQGASSENDFINKLSISHREAKETHYWLRLLKATDISRHNELDDLIIESNEIKRILGSIVGKMRRKLSK